jgi:opacity protein-like surface antigen
VLPIGRYARRGPDGRQYVRRPVPYLGAGIGMVYWQYEEEGDFVATDLSIVYDRLTDSGTTFETHVLAGVEFPVSPAWNITLEGRYSWANTSVGGAFTTINPGDLDLGGFSVLVGGALRF